MSQFAAQTAASVMPEELLYGVDGAVAMVTLNAPQRMNTISGPMLRQLTEALVKANEDRDVRAVILTGTGRAFCAGLNLEAQSKGTDSLSVGAGATPTNIDLRNTPPPVLHAMDKPVIAALNGHAIGLGLTLALHCDIRIFAADASYGVVQVRRGMVGDAYSHWVLPRLVGMSNAAEILLGGATFDGHRAVALGLGSRVLDAADVLPAALELAHDIAVNAAPESVAASKRLLWDSFDLDRDGVGARETEIHLDLMRLDDAKEGVRAFTERRPPKWTGR